MKVLFVTNMYPSSVHPYFGIFVARQAASLEREGVEVRVDHIAGPRGEWDYLAARGRIRRLCREWRPDVIHAHYGYSMVAVAGMGLPVVVTLCGDDVNGESNGRGGITFKSRIGVLVTNTLARSAAVVLVQSLAMRERLWAGVRRRAEVLGSGIDEQLFSPGHREEVRASFGFAPGTLVLGFVNSGGQPTKRLDLAQATRDELRRRGHTVELLVAEKVPADDMPRYYRAADCLLMTSDFEGSPNCVKEALSCGTPVVSVPVGDVPELMERPEMGEIVERTPAAVAAGVERVMARRQDTTVSLLPHRFRASSVAARLVEIYRSLAR